MSDPEEDYCGCEPGTYCNNNNHNPAPAPVEKQEVDFECDTCGLKSDDLAIVASLRAEVKWLRETLQGRHGLDVIYDHALRYWTPGQFDHLRRRLSRTEQLEAEARVDELHKELAAEKSAREKAEARVLELENLLTSYVQAGIEAQKTEEEEGGGYETRAAALVFLRVEKALAIEGRAILAARQKGESRG